MSRKFLFACMFLGTLMAGYLLLPTVPDEAVQTASAAPSHQFFLPFISATCFQPSGKVNPPPIVQNSVGPFDLYAAQSQMSNQGLDLAFNKIGFHTGSGGNRNGIGDYFRQLDARRVPIVIKSADDAGPIYEVLQLAKASGVPHVMIFRRTGRGSDEHGSFNYDVPDYSLSPREAANRHWVRHMRVFPPELYQDRSMIWLETINEVDKNRSEWLAEFAIETGKLALRDGFKWAAFGWSAGEPEPEHWRSPKMVEFLRFIEAHPHRLAIALHEYSYTKSEITNIYPYLVGRFHDLFKAADQYNIARPTVLITEWGWEYQNIPPHGQALEEIAWASKMYASYPQIKGVAIWYLGGNFGDIHNQTQGLIAPVGDFSVQTYYGVTRVQGCLDPDIFVED
ncbi:MAG: hypothetical protein QNJ45_06650 [Ardenticatenaceae bacterium]|nr:hypothetical protein [Ardenticatenaceae bacterium]